MQIDDAFVVQAPRDKVWEFFFDLERLGRCLPGVESIERTDDTHYRGKLKVKVGPIAARFNGTATLVEAEPPRRVVASIEGDDRSIGTFVKMTLTSTLSAIDGGTQVAYQMDVNLRGRLAQFGGAVIGATAKKMAAEFARNVKAQFES
ncbi:MAG TPA: carbon monoxide dehydrogenase subunit G [Anaerolineae bacterium]|nr:carbon monoxide dehydrogenase subunit G [Anaerolineae bacterium]